MLKKVFLFALCAGFVLILGTDSFAQRRSIKQKPVAKKVQSVRIALTRRGYEPETFKLKKGIPARVTFIRQTEDECGEEVVLPAYNIRRALPLNKPVTISFTPGKAGTFNFACGMDMLRGTIVVQ